MLKAASLKLEVALIDSELFLMFGSCYVLLFFLKLASVNSAESCLPQT